MNTLLNQALFLNSIVDLNQLPETGKEVAFLGRSNAGKSSALNAITDQKKLARTSKTPGRTQQINFFEVSPKRYLVDLPGYGFAKAPQAVKNQWIDLVDQYLRTRTGLAGLILLMDIRHPLKPLDQKVLNWAISANLPTRILLTKSDKLKRNPANQVLLQVNHAIKEHKALCTASLFSAVSKEGLEVVQTQVLSWLELEKSAR